jgi:hypothetical protein
LLTIAGQNPTGTVQSGVVSETLGMGTAGQMNITTPLRQMDPREHGEQVGTPARTGQVQTNMWHMQAGELAGLEAECARWTGHKGITVGNSTYP